jgi:hypothetical protein
MPSLPQGDSAAVREAARLLVAAERPLIRPGKLARTSAGWDRLIELAELLQAPVDVGGYASWQDFPSWHALYGSGGADYRPDVILGLELNFRIADLELERGDAGPEQPESQHGHEGCVSVRALAQGAGETSLRARRHPGAPRRTATRESSRDRLSCPADNP